MFEVGDKVVCIKNKHDGRYAPELILNNIYTISKSKPFYLGYYTLNELNYYYSNSMFISLHESRKLKIEKIKNNVYK